MKKFLLFLIILVLCISSVFSSYEKEKGPFGTMWLMTLEELKQVGNVELVNIDDGFRTYLFEPKNKHSSFDYIVVAIGDEEGLVKVFAYGNTIECNGYGTEL